ncbi:hypothetical protein SAMN05216436_102182 [bacterium A37T11]|nr:hypothetical protein SAMN05216436_102182 [bacterium A37T11]
MGSVRLRLGKKRRETEALEVDFRSRRGLIPFFRFPYLR